MTTKKSSQRKIYKTPQKEIDRILRDDHRDPDAYLDREETEDFFAAGDEAGLGALIRNLRECEDFTQTELAKMLKVSKSHLCDIEKQRKFLSPERAARFAKKLGYPEHYFIQLAFQDILAANGFDYRVLIRKKKF